MRRECRGRFSGQRWRVSDPNMHHGTCVAHVPWCIPGSLTSALLWSRWREKPTGISGACATRNFAYLIRGPWHYKVKFWRPKRIQRPAGSLGPISSAPQYIQESRVFGDRPGCHVHTGHGGNVRGQRTVHLTTGGNRKCKKCIHFGCDLPCFGLVWFGTGPLWSLIY